MKINSHSLILSALFLATAVPASQAQDSVPDALNEVSNIAVAAEVFYGFDLTDNDVDLAGVQFLRELYANQVNSKTNVDVFAALRVGYGDDDASGLDVWALFITASVGADVRAMLSDTVSVFARAQVGVNCTRTHFDTSSDEDSDFAWGFAYGCGAGIQYDITPTQSITVAVDYLGTTAEPEAKISGYTVTADKPEYITLSVGYKWSF